MAGEKGRPEGRPPAEVGVSVVAVDTEMITVRIDRYSSGKSLWFQIPQTMPDRTRVFQLGTKLAEALQLPAGRQPG